jgi:hypothetical protein
MRSHSLQASYHEIMRSDEWWEFENLSHIAIFDPSLATGVEHLRRQFAELDCEFPVREALQARPFCRCSFGIARERQWERLPETLSSSIQHALLRYRETLVEEKATITPLLQKFESDSSDKTIAAAATSLLDALRKGEGMPTFSLVQLQVLQKALGTVSGDSARQGGQYFHAEGIEVEVSGEVVSV